MTGADGEKTLTAKHIIVATGSACRSSCRRSSLTASRIISSDNADRGAEDSREDADHRPASSAWSWAVSGGRLGTQVLVVEFLDRIVPNMDKEMTTALQKQLEKAGLQVQVQDRRAVGDGRRREGEGRRTSGEEKALRKRTSCLWPSGRKPYTQGLGLAEVGVEIDKRGSSSSTVITRTKVPGIYAIGDVIGGLMLALKAEEEGVALVELLAGQAGHVNYNAVPNVVYTNPELASVGYGEDDAKARALRSKWENSPWLANGRARGDGPDGRLREGDR